jgi:hypothetical protein
MHKINIYLGLPVLLTILISVVNINTLYAQTLVAETYQEHQSNYTLYSHILADTTVNEMNSGAEDTLMVEEKPKLLPDKISWGEKLFWGENGVFRGLGIASPLTSESRKHELQVRRTMLTMHQIGGFVTVAAMLGTVWAGQRTIDNPRNKALRSAHQELVTATIITYSLTGLLSVLSPPPFIRRDDEGTTGIHKALAWVHFAGMIITPILAHYIGNIRSSNTSMNSAHIHQYAGYLTTAVFTASMIIMTF